MGVAPRRFRGLLFRHRDFRLLWTGATVGQLGDSISTVALPLVAVATLNASTFEVALLEAFAWIAWLIIGLPVGVWADRWRKRRMMIFSALASFVLFLSIPIAAAFGLLGIGVLLIVALLAGASTVVFETAFSSFLPVLVAADELGEGNATLNAGTSAAGIVGQGAGGLIAQLFGAVNGMLADAVSFLVTLVCVAGIRQPESPAGKTGERARMLTDMRTGLTLLFTDEWIRPITLFSFAANFLIVGFQSIQIVFLVRTVGLSAGPVGGLIAAGSAGGIVGAVVARWFGRRIGTARASLIFAVGATAFALLIPATFGGVGVVLFVAGSFLLSMGGTATNVNLDTFAQQYVPSDMLGRLAAGLRFVAYGAIPLGAVMGGLLGNALGTRTAILIMTALLPLTGLFLLFSPMGRVRDLPIGRPADGAQHTA